MKSCLIIAGGTLTPAFAGNFLEPGAYDEVIAVDGGLEVLYGMGRKPDAVVGDFDTVSPCVLKACRSLEGILWEEHKPEKDETDMELAIALACSMGCKRLTLLGATGGRLDHTIGNIHLLYAALQRGMAACILDEKNKVYLLDRGREFRREDLWGKYISFLPLTQEVKGISLEGFKYPLHLKDISIGTSLCISNELAGERGTAAFEEGILICVESHD